MNECRCVNVGSTSILLKEQYKSCFPSYTQCNTKTLCVEIILNYLISSGAFLILMMKHSHHINSNSLPVNLILPAGANRGKAINLIEKDDGGSHEVCLPGREKKKKEKKKKSPGWIIIHLTLQNSWRENRAWHLFIGIYDSTFSQNFDP